MNKVFSLNGCSSERKLKLNRLDIDATIQSNGDMKSQFVKE
ncbi:hypothetical protein R0131_02940 [Clostridium sp. AL.422]|nr:MULTISPECIES: hypothetical protein [unclassified Clostridium]MDV4149784.1 hypothetical protein [Clostridium sp. AL.422]